MISEEGATSGSRLPEPEPSLMLRLPLGLFPLECLRLIADTGYFSARSTQVNWSPLTHSHSAHTAQCLSP